MRTIFFLQSVRQTGKPLNLGLVTFLKICLFMIYVGKIAETTKTVIISICKLLWWQIVQLPKILLGATAYTVQNVESSICSASAIALKPLITLWLSCTIAVFYQSPTLHLHHQHTHSTVNLLRYAAIAAFHFLAFM